MLLVEDFFQVDRLVVVEALQLPSEELNFILPDVIDELLLLILLKELPVRDIKSFAITY